MNKLNLGKQKIAQSGFTLVELMIVVVIIGIISMVALPSFQSSMLKGKRSDAKSTLMDASSKLEQYYLDNKSYTATMTNIGFGNPANSPEGYYVISVQAATASCPITSCYVLLATAQGSQTDDSGCTSMTLSSVGEKAPSSCW